MADYDGTYLYGCRLTIDPAMANFRTSIHPSGTTAVGAFGEYGYGLADMAGNVIEWMNSQEPGVAIHKAFVGGSWYTDVYHCSLEWVNGAAPDTCSAHYGFRVIDNVQSPPPVPGAVLLGVVGLSYSGWWLRRRPVS